MKRIVLSLVATVSLTSNVVATNWIEDNAIEVGTSSGYYETQTRGIYNLGSKTIKFKEIGGTITPFHMDTPRFNIGCGGIDISMGGFSYLKKEFIIEKLKAISAAAPAFVYQMAISALCKDCQNIMNELEKFANMINGMSFDTCDAIQLAQGAGKKAASEAMNQSIIGGQSDSWISQRIKSGREAMEGWSNTIKSKFNLDDTKSKEVMDIMVLDGSLLNLVTTKGLPNVSKLDILGTDPNGDKLILSIFRAAVGDVIGGKDFDGNPTTYVDPGGTTNDLYKTIYEGGKLNITSYDTNTKKIKKIDAYEISKGTKDIIKDKITAIYNTMKMKKPLIEDDKRFLSTLSFPIYKILNVSIISGTGDLDFDILAKQIAADQTAQLVFYMTRLVARGISAYIAIHGKDIAPENARVAGEMVIKLNDINKQVQNSVKAEQDEIVVKQSLLEYIRKRKQEINAKLSTHAFYAAGNAR